MTSKFSHYYDDFEDSEVDEENQEEEIVEEQK